MLHARRPCLALFFSLGLIIAFAASTRAQTDAIYHRLDGRVQYRASGVGYLRVRLLIVPDMRPVAETFTRPEGQFSFSRLSEGDYIVETFETDKFEATSTTVSVRPLVRAKSDIFHVFVELPLKPAPGRVAPGVVAADVDLNVPKDALKHYRAGMKALETSDAPRAVKELQAAIRLHPDYYAARLELGRELRTQKRLSEAEETLRPLDRIASARAEPRVEQATVLLLLNRREDAIKKLQDALRLEETNWAAHLYLGWALLESDAGKAEPHFRRAIALDEQKAARAYIALARIADAKGEREVAIQHLDAYLTLAPNANDAESVRKLAERLRTSN